MQGLEVPDSGTPGLMGARLMGSSVSLKSNDRLCILNNSVTSIRLTKDIYLHCFKGCGDEKERWILVRGEGVRKRVRG